MKDTNCVSQIGEAEFSGVSDGSSFGLSGDGIVTSFIQCRVDEIIFGGNGNNFSLEDD